MSTKIQQIIRLIRLGLICVILILASAGCANLTKAPTNEHQQPSPSEVKPAPQVPSLEAEPKVAKHGQAKQSECFVHTVKWPGETLSYIAKWYTGTPGNWKVIANANPGLNPNRICEGNEILIPQQVLKTQKPLPKNFLARFTSRPEKKSSSKSSHQPNAENELPLFGPKEYHNN